MNKLKTFLLVAVIAAIVGIGALHGFALLMLSQMRM